jgi:hypothetical protein
MKHVLVIAAMFACTAAQAQTSAVDLGRALYFGTQAFAAKPTVSGVPLPDSSAACVSCHGALGRGSREGAQAAPDITQRLHHTPLAWADAAAHGKAADGHMLTALMPRYTLTAPEHSALNAYARLLGQAQDTVKGVSDKEILFGIYANNDGNISAIDNILKGVEHSFNTINMRGGVHGRLLRIQRVDSLQAAQAMFALVGGVQQFDNEAALLIQQRLPHLASLGMSREATNSRDWTVPLLPSVTAQSQLMLRSLAQLSSQHGCQAWVLDTAQLITDAQAQALQVRRFTQTTHAIQAIHATQAQAALDAAQPHSKLCLGIISATQSPAALVAQLQSNQSKQGQQVQATITLALSGVADVLQGVSEQYQVLPMPVAVAEHAQSQGQNLWVSLGEVAGLAVIEALARSGRALQPELVLAHMRKLTGYAPLANAPLVWSNTQAHGFEAALVQTTTPRNHSNTSTTQAQVTVR